MLNIIWVSFFAAAFITAVTKLFLYGDMEVFGAITQATFDSARTAFEIALGLTGVLTLWLGIMRIGERGGIVRLLTRALLPLFRRLFPEVPAAHPALGSIVMNMAANMMGLDNAATPVGLKAMRELQELNPHKERASNAQILFLVINTSSVTLFPVTIFTYRAQLGAADPTDVFIPILIATYISTLTGLITTAMVQRINLLDRVVLLYLALMTALVVGMLGYFSSLPSDEMQRQSAFVSHFLIVSLIVLFIGVAVYRRVNVYETFIDGAKEGFHIAVGIIPYLVAMLVAIGVLRASGALDLLLDGIRYLVGIFGWDGRFVDALPTAMMKPLSGGGARAMMVDAMQTYGPDSFSGRLASVFQGSTETTFYVLAVYFGAVGIRRARHAVACGLAADLGGILAAILVCYLFFA